MPSRTRRPTQAQKAKLRQKEYVRKLKQLEQYGIYNPTEKSLSKYRKTQINKRYETYRDVIGSKDFTFLDVRKSAKRHAADPKRIIGKAKALEMKTTRTGIFVAKEGSRKASLQYNRNLEEYEILLTGKTKWGKEKGKRITSKVPLASIDEIMMQKNRLLKEGNTFGKLKGKERLAFEIRGNGHDGFSHKTFGSIDELVKYVEEHYQKSPAAKIKFFRHIVIVKTEYGLWQQLHPVMDKQTRRKMRKSKVNKTGRNE